MYQQPYLPGTAMLRLLGGLFTGILAMTACPSKAQTAPELVSQLTAARQQAGYAQERHSVDLLNQVSKSYAYNNPDSTLYFANEALMMAGRQQYDAGQALAMRAIAKAFYMKGSYDSSLNFSYKALALCKKQRDSIGIAQALSNVGLIFLAHDEYDSAIGQFERSLSYAIPVKDSSDMAVAYFNIAVCHDEKREFAQTIEALQKTILVDKANPGHRVTIMAYNRMGKALFHQQRYAEAARCYNQVLAETPADNYWEITFAYGGLAEIAYANKDYKAAIANAQQSVAYAQKMNAKWDIEQALRTLARSYAAAGDYKNAYQTEVLDQVYNDSLFHESRNEVANYIRNQQKEALNINLQRENELNYRGIRLTHILNVCISIFAVTLLVTIVLLYKNYKHKSLLNRILLEKTKSIVLQKGKIAEQNHNLMRLNELKDQLFSVISHDLRGPIASIMQTLQLVNQKELTAEEQATIFPMLYQEVIFSNQMLTNLLNWATTQQSGIRADIKKTDVRTVLNDVIALYQFLAAKKDITLHCDPRQAEPVLADPNQLRIIFQNLISNAVKFTPGGGSVTIYFATAASQLRIYVRDTGVGIAPEKQSLLFTTFGAAVSSYGTNREKGTGIGLLLVKEFVAQNKGTLTLESVPGQGTTFCVALPLAV